VPARRELEDARPAAPDSGVTVLLVREILASVRTCAPSGSTVDEPAREQLLVDHCDMSLSTPRSAPRY
jgi:hypothetical protein